MQVLLFGGTSEGRELAKWLDARGTCEVVACSATDYGGELVSGLSNVRPVVGPLDDGAKEALVSENDFACIIDATHPYALHVSGSVARLAGNHGIPLLRLVRDDVEEDGCTMVEDAGHAARYAASRPGNILLTTGSKDLEVFVRETGDPARLYTRVLPVADSVGHARELGIPVDHIVAMQGPFSREFNAALMRELGIAVMVTKASGKAGGFAEKVAAAHDCGVEAVVIGRPAPEEGFTIDEAKRELEARYGA